MQEAEQRPCFERRGAERLSARGGQRRAPSWKHWPRASHREQERPMMWAGPFRGAAWSLSFAYDITMPYNIAKYRILRIGERKIDSIITRCHLHTTASLYCGKTSTQKSRTSWIFPWCDWVWWSMASIQPCKSWAMIFGHFITDLKLFENKCLILWCLYFGYWLLPVFCKCVYWCLIFQNQSAET